MKYYICPSVLSADLSEFGKAVQGLVKAGIEWIQVDVMDGHFVPNMTYGPAAVEAVRKNAKEPIIVDAHLMIEKPELWVADYVKAGANLVSVHVEATNHLHNVIRQIKKAKDGTKAGVALNPATTLSSIEEVLADIDLVVIMSVNPGFGGQEFIPSALDKVKRLVKMREERGLKFEIQVDGGVKVDNVATVAKAGANAFVMGSGIFGDSRAKQGDFGPIVKEAYAALKNI